MTEMQMGNRVLLIGDAWTVFVYEGRVWKRSKRGHWTFAYFIGKKGAKTA